MTDDNHLTKIAAKLDEAARALTPLLLDRDPAGATSSRASVAARRAHDALNALAVARLEVGLLQLDEAEGPEVGYSLGHLARRARAGADTEESKP